MKHACPRPGHKCEVKDNCLLPYSSNIFVKVKCWCMSNIIGGRTRFIFVLRFSGGARLVTLPALPFLQSVTVRPSLQTYSNEYGFSVANACQV